MSVWARGEVCGVWAKGEGCVCVSSGRRVEEAKHLKCLLRLASCL